MTESNAGSGDIRTRQAGRCASGVSHELNNLLGAIVSYSELLRVEESLTEEGRRRVSEIIAATEEAASYTESLLLASRSEASSAVTVDLGAMAHHALRLKTFALRRARVRVDIESSGSGTISGNPLTLLGLLLSLLDALVAAGRPGEYVLRQNADGTLHLPSELRGWPETLPDEGERCFCLAGLGEMGASIVDEGEALCIRFAAAD